MSKNTAAQSELLNLQVVVVIEIKLQSISIFQFPTRGRAAIPPRKLKPPYGLISHPQQDTSDN